MTYIVNGKEVDPQGECGLYLRHLLTHRYAVMDPQKLVGKVNQLPQDKARDQVIALRDMVDRQLQAGVAPGTIGSPILRGGPTPTPLEDVKGNLENLKRFTDEILVALGE